MLQSNFTESRHRVLGGVSRASNCSSVIHTPPPPPPPPRPGGGGYTLREVGKRGRAEEWHENGNNMAKTGAALLSFLEHRIRDSAYADINDKIRIKCCKYICIGRYRVSMQRTWLNSENMLTSVTYQLVDCLNYLHYIGVIRPTFSRRGMTGT